jgi:hypothetical protein
MELVKAGFNTTVAAGGLLQLLEKVQKVKRACFFGCIGGLQVTSIQRGAGAGDTVQDGVGLSRHEPDNAVAAAGELGCCMGCIALVRLRWFPFSRVHGHELSVTCPMQQFTKDGGAFGAKGFTAVTAAAGHDYCSRMRLRDMLQGINAACLYAVCSNCSGVNHS